MIFVPFSENVTCSPVQKKVYQLFLRCLISNLKALICNFLHYRLFKDLPEKHPVIVFKDAGEEIVRDLLLFMYRGEVEVQEAYLNDFLKFADTLQVKGLSQSDREEQAKNNNNNR